MTTDAWGRDTDCPTTVTVSTSERHTGAGSSPFADFAKRARSGWQHHAVVRIGRNVGTEPMPVGRWIAFQNMVRATFARIDQETSGTGEWDGIHEENYTIAGEYRAGAFWWNLGQLAGHFNQDAVAVYSPERTYDGWELVTSDGQILPGWPLSAIDRARYLH